MDISNIVPLFIDLYSGWDVRSLYRIIAALALSIIFLTFLAVTLNNWRRSFATRRELTIYIFLVLLITGLALLTFILFLEFAIVPPEE